MNMCPYHRSRIWRTEIIKEVELLLATVNPNWEAQHYITTEFYLDPVLETPEKFPRFSAESKSRQKWFITHYLLSERGWTPRAKRTKSSVCVNPMLPEAVEA
jgi:hypothetical protein